MKKRKRLSVGFFISIAAVLLIGLFIRYYIAGTTHIEGNSMNPAIKSGDTVLVNRAAYWMSAPRRGDIVLVYAGDPAAALVKRVLGLPGECVEISGGVLHVNGQPYSEPYLPESAGDDYAIALSDTQYLVLGDNRAISHDGRADDIGPVERAAFNGNVVCIIWPPDHAAWLR